MLRGLGSQEPWPDGTSGQGDWWGVGWFKVVGWFEWELVRWSGSGSWLRKELGKELLSLWESCMVVIFPPVFSCWL